MKKKPFHFITTENNENNSDIVGSFPLDLKPCKLKLRIVNMRNENKKLPYMVFWAI